MEKIEKARHSLSHLMAAVVIKKYPNAKLGIGPTIENGFYYDFGDVTISADDLSDIEKGVKKMAKGNMDFIKEEISRDEAREIFKDQPFKLELIDEITQKGEQVSVYKTCVTVEGQVKCLFTDLCAGPHVDNSKEINVDGFKITKLAGAYWRGSEKNPMLSRIYGLSFSTREELDAHLAMLAEAEKRDHRKIGKDLDLFTFSQLVGPGLPLWTPKGTILREALNNYVSELRESKGYQKVTIPHITKPDLYEKSGHWQKFSEELLKIQTREGKTYCLKPMNCPHHTQIYDHIPRSYKDLPQRYAETTMVYRDEQSGELGGLTRVLSITQDDAHVFCRMSQVKQEFFAVWEIIDTFYKAFDFKLKVRLSFHDPEKMENYLGSPEIWEKAENEIKEIAQAMKADYFMGIGEAAMYGPKLDFMATDALGREHQVATIQLDMNMPERFDLTCINEENQKERIVMIHCAVMGSIERFSAVLIEHLAGHFPLWASPVQVAIVPVSEKFNDYAKTIYTMLTENKIRVEVRDENETLGKKIRAAEMQKIPYLLVVGEKEVDAKTVAVRHRSKDEGVMSVEEFSQKALEEIKEKKN